MRRPTRVCRPALRQELSAAQIQDGFRYSAAERHRIFTNDLGFIVIAENGEVGWLQSARRRRHGHVARQRADFPAPGGRDWLFPAGTPRSSGQGGADGPSRFWRPHEPQTCAAQICDRRSAASIGSAVKWSKRAGIKLEPARPFQFTSQGDLLGWHQQTNGNYFLGLFVENGRIRDEAGYRLKTGLRRVIERFQPRSAADRVAKYFAGQHSPGAASRYQATSQRARRLGSQSVSAARDWLRWRARRCPPAVLPWRNRNGHCPDILTAVEGLLAEFGIAEEEIVVRMTGCPNGCARPYMAEIGFVGKGPEQIPDLPRRQRSEHTLELGLQRFGKR